jgi:hypothetical protein
MWTNLQDTMLITKYFLVYYTGSLLTGATYNLREVKSTGYQSKVHVILSLEFFFALFRELKR